MSKPDRKRLFIALPLKLPPGLLDLLGQLESKPGLKPVKPENTHLTLRFLGETPKGDIPLLEQNLENTVNRWHNAHDVGPMELQLKGLGSFPLKGAPRVLWAAIDGRDVPLLEDLAVKLEDELFESGFGRNDKSFKAHLTLARLRDKRSIGFIRQLIGQHRESLFGELVLDEMVLFSSQLTSQGPIYSREYVVKLSE